MIILSIRAMNESKNQKIPVEELKKQVEELKKHVEDILTWENQIKEAVKILSWKSEVYIVFLKIFSRKIIFQITKEK